MQLYEIANEYADLFRQLNEVEDITDECINDTLSHLTGELNDKMLNIAAYIKNIEAEAGAVNSASQLLNDRYKKLSNKSEKLRKYLKLCMEIAQIDQVKNPYHVVSIKNNPLKVKIENERDIPNQYWKVQENKTLDKLAIKEHIQQGGTVLGVSLIKETRIEVK